MKKTYIFISILVALGIGVIIGKGLYDKPVKALSLTVYADDYPNQIKDIDNITDKTQAGEEVIDNLIMLLIQADWNEEINLPEDKSGYSFRLYSIKSGYTLKTGDFWIFDNGTALIANPTDDDQSPTRAFYLNEDETILLKQLVESF